MRFKPNSKILVERKNIFCKTISQRAMVCTGYKNRVSKTRSFCFSRYTTCNGQNLNDEGRIIGLDIYRHQRRT